MKVLMIAPQPFFEPRGTPISVLHRLKALTALGYQVDLVTYHVGEQVEVPGVTVIRSPNIPFIRRVKIGPSMTKIFLDILLVFAAGWLLLTRRYDVVHSHEEAAYFAMVLCWLFRTPHLYDMHASLPKLMGSFSFGNYRPVISVMKIVERLVLKTCDVVLTVGIDLEKLVSQINPTANQIRIENIAAQNEIPWDQQSIEDLRRTLVPADKLAVVYTGTFEGYQGLEMLFASVPMVVSKEPNVMFVMIGGSSTQVAYWQQEISQLGLADHVVFIGTVALDESLRYLAVADILVSPRTGGPSVPLKIYSYLQSGKPMVATNIYAHTQVLDETTAVLTDPTPAAFAEGLLQLIADPELRQTIGQNACAFVEREYSWESYLEKLEHAYLSIKYRKPISDIRSSNTRAGSTALANP